jgi:predicted RNase H-like HicB family nuclease
MEYIAYLHKDGKSDYGVSFPDFPGAITAGKTLEEARHLAGELLTLHIQGLVEDGQEIPEPSSLDELAKDPAMKGAVAFLVTATTPDAVVRVNITARESQLERIDALAQAAGLTRSAYLVQAAMGKAAPHKATAVTRQTRRPARKHSPPARSSTRRSAAPESVTR